MMTPLMQNIGAAVQPGAPVYNPAPASPPTGLIGREQALQSGLQGALGLIGGNYTGGGNVAASDAGINANRDIALGQVRAGVNNLNRWVSPGNKANQAQAALSGAMGSAAQQQAYNRFNESPGQQWLRDQAERSLTRNAAAIGGLGGGNVRQALQRQAMGLAQQDFDNYYNRMGTVADRGMNAAGLQSSLRNAGVNAASAAGGQSASLAGAAIGANASMRNAALNANVQLGRTAADYAYQTGLLAAQGRTDAGNALAGLAQGQGSGLADMYSQGGLNIAQMLAGNAANQAGSYTGRGTGLSNINMTGAGTYNQVNGLGSPVQNPGVLGSVGDFLGGVGSFMTGMPQPQKGP